MGSFVPPRGMAPAQPVLSIPQKKSSVMADVGSLDSAKKAAKSGMWAAFFVAGVSWIAFIGERALRIVASLRAGDHDLG